jgi:hypothetical protein
MCWQNTTRQTSQIIKKLRTAWIKEQRTTYAGTSVWHKSERVNKKPNSLTAELLLNENHKSYGFGLVKTLQRTEPEGNK